jgi:hypothetical protein
MLLQEKHASFYIFIHLLKKLILGVLIILGVLLFIVISLHHL